ncbi:MAG: hypothetical protein ACO1OB_14080 [Archangium sp.]
MALVLGITAVNAAGRVIWVANALPFAVDVSLGSDTVHVDAETYASKVLFNDGAIDVVTRGPDGGTIETAQIPKNRADHIYDVLGIAPLGFETAVYGNDTSEPSLNVSCESQSFGRDMCSRCCSRRVGAA